MLGGINLLQLEFRFFNNDYKRIRFFIIVFKFITSLLYSTGYSRAVSFESFDGILVIVTLTF